MKQFRVWVKIKKSRDRAVVIDVVSLPNKASKEWIEESCRERIEEMVAAEIETGFEEILEAK